MKKHCQNIAFIELRPTCDFGDHCVLSSLEDAEYISVYTSDGISPSTRHEIFDDLISALDEARRLAPDAIWYNGNELLTKIESMEDLSSKLSEIYCDDADDDQQGCWLRGQLGLPA